MPPSISPFRLLRCSMPSCRKIRPGLSELPRENPLGICISIRKSFLLQGIEPINALHSLHIRLADGTIIRDIEAYEALFALVWWLRPVNGCSVTLR